MKAYVWRDKHDANQFWIGTQLKNGSYAGWIPVFCDAFNDCFGPDAWELIQDHPPGGDPVPVDLSMKEWRK